MIGLSQWRAAIGLWNSCRIHPVDPNPQVQDGSFHKRSFAAVSGDTICRVVTLMFYLLFLLLLSGDVELNPGPITVEQGNSDCLY